MAQHDRNMLKKTQIKLFQAWLDANGIEHRPGKGEYQLLQVKTAKGWPAICIDAKGVITTPSELAQMINLFNLGKSMPSNTMARADAIAVEQAQLKRQQFLDDLRDDFAMAALQARAAGDYSAWADLAADAYNIADAMLAERAKRVAK